MLAISRVCFALPMLVWLLASGPAHADWRDDIGTFRIGMVAKSGSERGIAGLGAIKQGYSRALGLPVEIFVAQNYTALIRAQADKRLDYAIYSAAAFAAASRLCDCVEPLAAPLAEDGSEGVRALVIARAGKANSLAEASRLSIGAGPRTFPGPADLALARLATVDSAGSGGEILRAETQNEAEMQFAAGRTEVLVGWIPASPGAENHSGTLSRLQEFGMSSGQYSVVWRSDVLRFGPHAVRKDAPGDARLILRRFLTALRDNDRELYGYLESDHGGGFVEVNPADYDAALQIVDYLNAAGSRK